MLIPNKEIVTTNSVCMDLTASSRSSRYKKIQLLGVPILQATKSMGVSGQKCLISGIHLDSMFSNESLLSML